MKTAAEYLGMLREMKDTSMATVGADGTPRVRIIDTMLTEGERLYFLTARGKEFFRELAAGQTVAVSGLNDRWETVRAWGKVRNVGQDLLDRIFEENPSMKGVYPGETRDILEVFCLYEGQGEYFCLAEEPIVREPFTFGGAATEAKGFLISDRCIACGTCSAGCPQGAVDEGAPYVIRQENCLHCGRDRKSTRLNSSHNVASRMPSSA